MTTPANPPNPPETSNPPNQNNSSQRVPKTLENDLRRLLDDERFYDVSLKCSDNVVLRACKNILAIRTEVFNECIFDKSKKNVNHQQQQLDFERINSIAMKLILEYLYTSKNERETLNVDNVVEVYYAAIYFKLDDLQDDIIEFTRQSLRNGDDELGKKLLSNFIEKFTLEADNEMGKLLVDWVAKIQLHPDKADEDNLSLMGLQYLLNKTYETNKPFATYEITLFEYTLIKTKQIILEEKVGSKKEPYDMNYESNVIERIKERLKPLLPYIDLRIIDPDEVVLKLEPLRVFPADMITAAYRYRIEMKHETLKPIRGRLTFRWKNPDKESKSKLIVRNNGATVEVEPDLKQYKTIMGDLLVKGNGIHKWDILIENISDTVYIGICSLQEKFEIPGDKKFHGWALGSDGYVYSKNDYKKNNAKFTVGDVVNITVNMTAKHCYFGLNDHTYYEVIGHAFSDEVYPFATLNKGAKLRIK